jgi:hypothetical protein
LVNSRLGLFSAAPSGSPARGGFTLPGRPFSRSYGANLPSSLTRDHPSPSVLSHPATGVGLRYGRARPPARGFSRGRIPTESAPREGGLPDRLGRRPKAPPARPDAASPARRSALCAPSSVRTCSSARGDGMSTVCPSATPFGLALGPTDPPRMDLAEETSAIRGAGFPPASRYSCRHSHSMPLHPPSQPGFTAGMDAPLPRTTQR